MVNIRFDPISGFPDKAEWIMIAVFLIGALALIPKYITLSSQDTGILLLVGALISLAVTVFTTQPAVVK
jgi:hypothetical protein